MVLYDSNKHLIAISDNTLETLGFRSLEEFKRSVMDIAELFVKKPGYIHQFKSFHWIDYILTNSTVTHRAVLKTKDGREFEVFVNVNQLYGLEYKNFYLVTFEPNTYDECIVEPKESPSVKRAQKPETVIRKEEKTVQIRPQPKEFEKPDLEKISEELNLSEEIVVDFIKEFINHSLERVEEINSAVEKGDIQKLKNIIHTLRGVSANLRLKPAVEILKKSKNAQDLDQLIDILEEFYSYILFLAKELGIKTDKDVVLKKRVVQQCETEALNLSKNENAAEQKSMEPKIEKVTKELGISLEEYREYLKELINEIKLNLAYNNFNELHKLASFARNLYLQECAKYLDQVSINQNPQLVKQCVHDLEQLKKEPNPFIVTVEDLEDSLQMIQIDKKDFTEIIEDLIIELKTLKDIKMRKEKFLKKTKQLKSIAESLRLSNLVLLMNNILSNYPLDKFMLKQLEEAIQSLEKSVKEMQAGR